MLRIQNIIQYCIAYIIVHKHGISIKKLFAKYHANVSYTYINDKGVAKTIKSGLYHSFRKDTTLFSNWLVKITNQMVCI